MTITLNDIVEKETGRTMDKAANNLPILDEHHLRRQTMNDPDLETEILSLFVTEAERLIRQIEGTKDVRTRMERIHAIRGLARNVGAQRLAMIAAVAENCDETDIRNIRLAVDTVVAYIRTSERPLKQM